MKMNYIEKIKKIDDDRVLMLNSVKENIIKKNTLLSSNLNDIILLLNNDEVNTKKYKNIIKAKQFIFELTEQIANATNIEDIVNLRKKVNYYINKIKKELAGRNISSESFEKMYSSVNYLRTDISRYISFLKRKEKLTEIAELYKDINNLSQESITKLKKLLSNEIRYNKRYILSINDYHKKDTKKTEKKSSVSTDSIIKIQDKELDEIEEQELSEENMSNIPLNFFAIPKFEDKVHSMKNDKLSYTQDLNTKIDCYLHQYNFLKITSYKGNFLKKCLIFLKNIPKYVMNKKIIKYAEYDYNIYYHGDDLGDFINYFRKNNSIQLALELIFQKSSLSKREIDYLFEHQKCTYWIIEFCNQQKNSLETHKKLYRSRNYI